MSFRVLSLGRYIVMVPIIAILLASLLLTAFEAVAFVMAMIDIAQAPSFSLKAAKALAVGLIEVVDVFLIAITMYLIGLSLYVLFVDDTLALPSWLKVRDLEDLKANLVSLVIVVLAVMFLREAVAWSGNGEILSFALALALMIAPLAWFLSVKGQANPSVTQVQDESGSTGPRSPPPGGRPPDGA
ncbi:MAG TPA: YqhA family protein [Lamprocystis sp. (in: g-proteobacteria)]|nr:YqhA family protein [Lamprocystis sp. (in: g-proteobacteria)]